MSEKALEGLKEAMERRMRGLTIELDCAPGAPRPDTYIKDVLEGTGLPVREPVSKVFGNWTWDFSDIEGIEERWPEIQKLTKPRVTELFNSGRIRYGSW